ncbi:hypothetical protein QR680_003737 [Steinernema hermaphroditum]|uniref:Uncharacterized protein n=1 Tax=Steinernema hermaphroditum TaxID=289476 RepID=A0AA39LSU6_9BILA|nr:hypothetical protein QR680_003737 [Steinernema hermaphroditum]
MGISSSSLRTVEEPIIDVAEEATEDMFLEECPSQTLPSSSPWKKLLNFGVSTLTKKLRKEETPSDEKSFDDRERDPTEDNREEEIESLSTEWGHFDYQVYLDHIDRHLGKLRFLQAALENVPSDEVLVGAAAATERSVKSPSAFMKDDEEDHKHRPFMANHSLTVAVDRYASAAYQEPSENVNKKEDTTVSDQKDENIDEGFEEGDESYSEKTSRFEEDKLYNHYVIQ